MAYGNGNGSADEVEYVEDDSDDKQIAAALTDRALTAIGGLETEDPMDAAEQVAQVYLRLLRAVRDEE